MTNEHNIESQFNACMHKEYCLSLKAGQVRPLDENALSHTINMMPWRTDELGPKLREFAGQLWTQFCSAPAAPAPAVPQINYHPGTWYEVKTREELEAFFLSRLPAIREAAREHGYAIGLHGSLRRDMDLIAVPWRDGASDKDKLAHAIAMAAVGITRDGGYKWEAKPAGRVATSLACAWTTWYGEAGAGHIDLSVMPAAPSQPVTLTDEATKNAARYVWLRDVHIGNNPEYINLNPVKNGGLDAAIDALREKEQAK